MRIVQLVLGPITQGIVNLAADKTKVTNQAGDKSCHPLYFVPGNIKKEFRREFWQPIALIPVVKFKDKRSRGVLNARLYHKCLDIVLHKLKEYSHKPKRMVDPYENFRDVCTVIGAFQSDTPEQNLIACVAGNQSPISLAEYGTLGNPDPSEPRLGSRTLKLIEELGKKCDVNDLGRYVAKAKKIGLNGVYKPFWRDWKFAEPHIFLAPDALHFWHKFFWDHVVRWCRILLGDEEFDRRLSVLQPIIGERHFGEGVTQFQQHTAREARDVAKKFLAVVAGHPNVTPGVMKALRAMIDFIYIAQYESHSTGTLVYLNDALLAFHANKDDLRKAGVRKGKKRQGRFEIPKLERMWQVGRSCLELGASYQFSTEDNERDHKRFIKATYAMTNKKDFQPQMCRTLSRREKDMFFRSLLEHQGHIPKTGKLNLSANPRSSTHLTSVQHRWPQFVTAPAVQNLFTSRMGSLSSDTTAFQLNVTPAWANMAVDLAAAKFNLTQLRSALADYHSNTTAAERGWMRIAHEAASLPYVSIDVWHSVRIQNKAEHDGKTVLPPATLQALPPNEDMPFGRRHFALFRQPEGYRVQGIQSKLPIPCQTTV